MGELWGKLTCSIVSMVQDNKEELCDLREEPEWEGAKGPDTGGLGLNFLYGLCVSGTN